MRHRASWTGTSLPAQLSQPYSTAAADRSDRACQKPARRSRLIDDDYSGFARDIVAGPRRGSKRADARCRNAATAVSETGAGEECIRIGFLCDVPLGNVMFAR